MCIAFKFLCGLYLKISHEICKFSVSFLQYVLKWICKVVKLHSQTNAWKQWKPAFIEIMLDIFFVSISYSCGPTACLPKDKVKVNTCLAWESMVASWVSACNKIWLAQWRGKKALIISDQIFTQALPANNSPHVKVIISTWFPINFEPMTDTNQIWKMDRIKCQQMSWT